MTLTKIPVTSHTVVASCGNCKYWVAMEHKLPDGTTYSYEDELLGNCVFQVPEWVNEPNRTSRNYYNGEKCPCYSPISKDFDPEPGEKWLEENHYVPIVSSNPSWAQTWRRPFGWPDVMLLGSWWCVIGDDHETIADKSPKDALIKFAKNVHQNKVKEKDGKSSEVKYLKKRISLLGGMLEELGERGNK